MTPLTLRAHAKINLNLKVLGRRPDGYHDILSLAQTISLHDTLEFLPAGEFTLEVKGGRVPEDASNLVWRAADALRRTMGIESGATVRLTKNVPVGAGLGGGSSDAAAALAGLSRLWRLRAGRRELAPIAAGLGADVPFFLTGGAAILAGTGTEVRPLPDPAPYELVLVIPGVPVATREVYARLPPSLTPTTEISSMTRFAPAGSGSAPWDVLEWVRAGNDLEPYAREFCPAIGEIKDRLVRTGASAAAMSGSGSSVFAIFRDRTTADRARRDMEDQGFGAVRCTPLGRTEHHRSLCLD